MASRRTPTRAIGGRSARRSSLSPRAAERAATRAMAEQAGAGPRDAAVRKGVPRPTRLEKQA
eukprot:11191622-Lingulodinium_polyedra.AAC.1